MAKYPQGQLEDLSKCEVSQIITSIMELHDKGKPETDEEVSERIQQYFDFCSYSSIRPGFETLSMALHVSRGTVFNWMNGIGCSKQRQEILEDARTVIHSFLEQALLSGKISPPSGIFLAKNWMGYKDTVSFEDSIPHQQDNNIISSENLPKLLISEVKSNANETSLPLLNTQNAE